MFNVYGMLSLGSISFDTWRYTYGAGGDCGMEMFAFDSLRCFVSAFKAGKVRRVKAFDISEDAEWIDFNRYYFNYEKPVKIKATACVVELDDGQRVWCAFAKRRGCARWNLLVRFKVPARLTGLGSGYLALLCPATAYTRARKPERVLAALLEANKDE